MEKIETKTVLAVLAGFSSFSKGKSSILLVVLAVLAVLAAGFSWSFSCSFSCSFSYSFSCSFSSLAILTDLAKYGWISPISSILRILALSAIFFLQSTFSEICMPALRFCRANEQRGCFPVPLSVPRLPLGPAVRTYECTALPRRCLSPVCDWHLLFPLRGWVHPPFMESIFPLRAAKRRRSF